MEGSSSRLLLAAAASAATGSLLTYALLRLRNGSSCGRTAPQPGPPAADEELAPARLQDPYDPSPRVGYLCWDDYFMAVAFLSAQRSKDPAKQVGACIVDQNNVICGIGYNGFPRGCADSELPWAKKSTAGDPLATKYPYVCHAEMNAILNKNGASVVGARVFVTMFPCNECAKLMIQAGIREVVYHEAKDQPARSDSPIQGGFSRDQQYTASRRLLALAGVKLRQHLFRQPVVLRLTNEVTRPAAVVAVAGNSTAEQAAKAVAAAAGAAAEAEVAPAVAAVLRQNGGLAKAAQPNGAAAKEAAANGAAAAGIPQHLRRRRGKPVHSKARQQQAAPAESASASDLQAQ